jgi:ectoine hydroxylase-related dioxygenase (phytanoyl-CoA dioxygenase family)
MNATPASPALHGIQQQTQAGDALLEAAEMLRAVGYALIPSGLSEPQLTNLRDCLEATYQTQVQEAGDLAALQACQDLDVARCPLSYDEIFIEVAAHAGLMNLVRHLLGEHFVLLQQNGLFNRPQTTHYQTHWHRDLSYQHWTSTEPLALNALLTLDDFTLENGATHVLPASHLRSEFPSDAYVRQFEQPLQAPAGTFLVMDAMLFHRAGRNTTQGQRRGINHLIGRPFMAQQFDLARMVHPRHGQDPFLHQYLGFRWSPCASVAAWRRLRSNPTLSKKP